MFWEAVFQTRLVLERVSAADLSGVFALLQCKSVLVFHQKFSKFVSKVHRRTIFDPQEHARGLHGMHRWWMAWSMHAAVYFRHGRQQVQL
jgi:hypothetical protein